MWFNEHEGYLLRTGHGWSQGRKLGMFKDCASMEAFICQEAKQLLEKIREEVEEALALMV
ncbi:MAG: hypothetical protein WBK28_00750 [Minisyncoccia bacterium]